MLKVIARWLVPGLVVVLGGTAVTVFATEANIASDLQGQATALLVNDHDNWADIRFDARDATLSGTAADQASVDAATQQLLTLHGVRSVQTQVTVAPLAHPYPFTALVENGKLKLRGAAPDAETRALLVADAGDVTSQLQLRAGVPDRAAWLEAARFAIGQAKDLDQGKVELSDLTFSLSGRARSERSYGDLLLALHDDAPRAIQVGTMNLSPPLASPYEWSAQSDGHKISITGFVPDDVLVDRFRSDAAGLPVATGLTLASGQPEAFAENTRILLTNLARLDYGSATIIDGHRTLTGAPPNPQIAQAILDEVKPTGTIVVLEPPKVADFHIGAILKINGTVKFEGFIPDDLTRETLAKVPLADTTGLSLGRGGPDRLQSALDFSIAALQKMSEGRFDIRGNKITLQGVARSVADFKALQSIKSGGAPQGFQLTGAEFAAASASPYIWQATKAADGKIRLSGFVPDEKARASLLSAAQQADDTTSLASGEPKGFVSSAITGLSLLNSVATGSVAYDGSGWTISGQSRDAAGLATLNAAFVAQGLAGAGWTMSVTGPQPAPILPYIWSATRDAGGIVALAGHVPDQTLQKQLLSEAGKGAVDQSEIGAGAPANFATAAHAGLAALMSLQQGDLKFDGVRWSLSGIAAADVSRSMQAALAAKVAIAAWTVDIAVPRPAIPAAPYAWSATRAADGGIKLAGSVPTESLQRFAAARAGKVTSDTTAIVAGAPAGFINDVLAALDALAQLDTGIVSFDGKTWSISGQLQVGKNAAAVEAVLAAAATPAKDWSKDLAIKPSEPVAVVPDKPAAPAVDPDYAFSAIRDAAGATVLTGEVPADPARSYLGSVSGGSIDALTIAPNPPEDFLTSAEAGLRALLLLSEGKLDFTQSVWSLSGKATDQKTKDAVTTAIAALPNGAAWKLDIAAPALIDACRTSVAAFMQNNTILFKSGGTAIADESQPALDDLAKDLALCPDNVVQIEGHTDADGDADQNLGLSVARAEAVINALISRNILAARLYAVGFGESDPIASNETAAGKRQNRRIVINVLDEHY